MKYTFYLLILSVFAFSSCKNDKSSAKNAGESINVSKDENLLALNKKIFNNAIRNKDKFSAIYAANSIIAMDSASAGIYFDTLASLYLDMRMIDAAGQIANKVLAKDPNNKKMLEIKAAGMIASGDLNGAVTINKKLYDQTHSLKYLFEMGAGQLQIGNIAETEAALDQVEKDPAYTKDSVDLPANQGQTQKVPIEAATLFLRANIDYKKHNMQEFVAKLEQSVKIFPKFYIAQSTLNQIMQQQQQAQQQGGAPRGPGGPGGARPPMPPRGR